MWNPFKALARWWRRRKHPGLTVLTPDGPKPYDGAPLYVVTPEGTKPYGGPLHVVR